MFVEEQWSLFSIEVYCFYFPNFPLQEDEATKDMSFNLNPIKHVNAVSAKAILTTAPRFESIYNYYTSSDFLLHKQMHTRFRRAVATMEISHTSTIL